MFVMNAWKKNLEGDKDDVKFGESSCYCLTLVPRDQGEGFSQFQQLLLEQTRM